MANRPVSPLVAPSTSGAPGPTAGSTSIPAASSRAGPSNALPATCATRGHRPLPIRRRRPRRPRRRPEPARLAGRHRGPPHTAPAPGPRPAPPRGHRHLEPGPPRTPHHRRPDRQRSPAGRPGHRHRRQPYLGRHRRHRRVRARPASPHLATAAPWTPRHRRLGRRQHRRRRACRVRPLHVRACDRSRNRTDP